MAMVAMIQPDSDFILMAWRTPSHSTAAPWAMPNIRTTGSIAQ